MGTDFLQPLAVTVNQACNLLGIRPTKLYELLASGELIGALIGGRRLVIYKSIVALLERSRTDPGSFSEATRYGGNAE